VGVESGAITGCAGADRRPLGALQMRIVSRRRGQARWVYNRCVFRGQEGNCGSEPWSTRLRAGLAISLTVFKVGSPLPLASGRLE